MIISYEKIMNYWLWLASIEDLSSTHKLKLLKELKTPENIYKANISEILNILNIGSEKIAEKIIQNINLSKKSEKLFLLDKYEKYMTKNNIYMLNIDNKIYPDFLKNIYDPPITLFLKGNIKLLYGNNIAIVGSRDATNYGLINAFKIGYELSNKGFNIVSGLAKGIDASAHKGALNAKINKLIEGEKVGSTIAIIGSRT